MASTNVRLFVSNSFKFW